MSARFFQSIMGRQFIEGTVPRILKELHRLNKNLERLNDNLSKITDDDSSSKLDSNREAKDEGDS